MRTHYHMCETSFPLCVCPTPLDSVPHFHNLFLTPEAKYFITGIFSDLMMNKHNRRKGSRLREEYAEIQRYHSNPI